jgi:hypothetical protein
MRPPESSAAHRNDRRAHQRPAAPTLPGLRRRPGDADHDPRGPITGRPWSAVALISGSRRLSPSAARLRAPAGALALRFTERSKLRRLGLERPVLRGTVQDAEVPARLPGRFDSIETARAQGQRFFTWYNEDHRHGGLGLHTPPTSTTDRHTRSRTAHRRPRRRLSTPTPNGSATNRPDRRRSPPTRGTTHQTRRRSPLSKNRKTVPHPGMTNSVTAAGVGIRGIHGPLSRIAISANNTLNSGRDTQTLPRFSSAVVGHPMSIQRSRGHSARSQASLAHWCTILRSVIPDGSLMRPRCRQVIARLARPGRGPA